MRLIQDQAEPQAPAAGPSLEEMVPTARFDPTRELSSGKVEPWYDKPLVTIGETPVTAASLITATVIVLFSFQVSRVLQRLLRQGMQRAGIEAESTLGTVGRLIHYTAVLVGVLVAVNLLGIELQALLTAGAVFAVAFGFAMQNIAQNFVSGVILLFERTIQPGDTLEVDGRVVHVVEMGIRTTIARTRDEEELILPNALLVQNTVKNYTLRDNLHRLRAQVGVAYESDMELVAKTLEEVGRNIDWREKDRAPRVLLREFGDSSVLWELSVWIQNPWHEPRLRSRLLQSMWFGLKEKGITIAFPQMDVHMDRAMEELMRQLTRRGGDADENVTSV